MITAERTARRKVSWLKKLNPFWALFGNEDDGFFGDDPWRNGRDRTFLLAVEWWLRNPMHNLTWYVIGVADKDRTITGPWGDKHANPDGGLLWSIVKAKNKGIPLPYVNYTKGYFKMYAGWRPSGAFGFKFNIVTSGDAK